MDQAFASTLTNGFPPRSWDEGARDELTSVIIFNVYGLQG